MKIRWLARAADDLESLFNFIERNNPNAAAQTVVTVIATVKRLMDNPALGRPGRVPDTRELVIDNYIVAYRVKADVVQVLRVLHGARSWPRSL